MDHRLPATRTISRTLLDPFPETGTPGAAKGASTSAEATAAAAAPDRTASPNARAREARASLPAAFAGLPRPGATSTDPEASPRPAAAGSGFSTPPRTRSSSAAAPLHGYSTPPRAPANLPSPRTPTVLMSPGAVKSPCQNKSFDRIASTLYLLGARPKSLKNGDAKPRPLEAGGSVIYKLKSVAAPTGEEFNLQFARAEKKYKKMARNAAVALTPPDPATFRAEGSPLMNLDVELHFGGGKHSDGDMKRGSYVKADGWFIDDNGVKQTLSNRAGRHGAFSRTAAYNHEPIDEEKVNQARAARDPSAPPRLPALKNSPARPKRPAMELLAMAILEPEIANNNLTAEFVSRYVNEKMASVTGKAAASAAASTPASASASTSAAADEGDADFPARFNGLMKALNAYRPEPDES